jgi:hypothetical protein
MTQDQYGQARGPGYVVRGDAVPEDETEGYETEQTKPMTRFQKVASALRGDRTDEDETGQAETGRVSTGSEAATGSDVLAPGTGTEGNPPWVTEQDEAAMTNTPISRDTAGAQPGNYWDEPGTTGAGQDEAVAVTSPDGPAAGTGMDPAGGRDEATGPGAVDHAATEPDMFGTAAHAANGTAPVPAPEGQAGAATIADIPASNTPAPASDVPAPADEATGTTGRHAAGTPAGSELRPGEAAGTLGDFSDLTYGNLIPDAAHYSEQWQQIQFRFVDDPRASVTEAADIVAQVTAKMEAAIQERQRAIEERQHAIAEQQRSLRGRWGEDANADTEALRETLRMYKTFLDQLIGPRAS